MITLLACLWLPFSWILTSDPPAIPALLGLFAGMPALLPAEVISNLAGHNHDLLWLAILLTGIEISVGTRIIRVGPRSTIAYLVFVLLMSTFGSFGINALMRA